MQKTRTQTPAHSTKGSNREQGDSLKDKCYWRLVHRAITFCEYSARSEMRRGTQLFISGSCVWNCLSLSTTGYTQLLEQFRSAARGIRARHSPSAISSSATTPTAAQEPCRPIYSCIRGNRGGGQGCLTGRDNLLF